MRKLFIIIDSIFWAFNRIFNWIKIALSPILGGTFLGIIILFSIDNKIGKFLALAIFIGSILIGIFLAERIRKKYGTIEYNSKIYESSDLNNIQERYKSRT